MRRTSPSSRSILGALGASGALVLAALPMTPAGASAPGATVAFSATGATQTYTVPASVCELTVSLAGAQGGHGDLHSGWSGIPATGGVGGAGGTGTATLLVQPGQVLSVDVGAAGANGITNYGWTQAAGGFGGGASAGYTVQQAGAGGGGGATTVSIAGAPVMVVGGGGGGGGGREAANGGAGGGLNQAGSTGSNATSNAGGGGGGTLTEGGAGGQFGAPYYNDYFRSGWGASGSAGAGGGGASAVWYSDAFFGGAGGGGGYFGGGGGGAGNDYYVSGQGYNGGGGGGGGSGYVVDGALDLSTWSGHDGTGDGSASITPAKTCSDSTVDLLGLSSSQPLGQVVNLTAASSASGTVTFSADGTALCSDVATTDVSGTQTATCDWTPSAAGLAHLSTTFTPSDPTSYLSSSSAPQDFTVTNCTRCTVTFDANGGTGRAATQVFRGVSQNLKGNHYKWARHTFVGWAFSSGASSPDLVNTQNFQAWGDLTLYAVWVHTTSTVSFDANGGSGRMVPQRVSTDATTLPGATFVRAGKTFLGWSLKSGGKRATIADGATIDVPKNLTLYAIWH
jgi:uncharacterized repeat protein (TIGR02543 family)